MNRSAIGALASGLLMTPSFAIAPNCVDHLAEIKAEMTSEVMAQSGLGEKYEEANRLCAAGNDMQAQALAREIREKMVGKSTTSGARESSGSSDNRLGGNKQE